MLKGKTVFRSKRFSVERVIHRVRGQSLVRDRIVSRDSAVLIAFVDKDHVLLERNYRFSVGKWLWEMPAGYLEEGEKPEKAAARELQEETGYAAEKIEFMFSGYVAVGSKTERSHFFVATGLRKTSKRLDPGEQIKISEVRLGKVVEMIDSKEIEDNKSILCVLYYLHRYRGMR
ncbi:MAG: NUDIX hydrolase [Candidatus Micrarchaeota archaeon]|nr:NUDIX hydrolase [Candidatus Micrarchaeota archaeon]